MATIARLRAKTSALMTLWAAIDFGEFLTIVFSITPTSTLAGFVTGCAVSFAFFEFVNIEFLGVLAGDDFIPVDALDVA